MGNKATKGQSQFERTRSKEIEKAVNKDSKNALSIFKLLLLGAGESGKSTLFKQMNDLYGQAMDENMRKRYSSTVNQNTVDAMKRLCEQASRYSETPPEIIAGTSLEPILEAGASEYEQNAVPVTAMSPDMFQVLPENAEAMQRIMQIDTSGIMETVLKPQTVQDIKALWQDPAIRRTYRLKTYFQLPDSALYYFGRLDAIGQDNYVPSREDVLRTRVKTTGIIETDFQIGGATFKVMDVGGQRSERKKWLHLFQDVSGIIFLISLSGYDQTCIEDNTTKRLDEALELFEQIVNSQFLQSTSMILFLNKKDLLATKLESVPYTVYDPNFTGDPHSLEQVAEEIKSRVLSKNQNKQRQIYTHITCATDPDNIRLVVSAVKDIILKKALESSNLI